MNKLTPKIAVVGLGQMGRSMATRLHNSNWEVTGFNRTVRDELADLDFEIYNNLGLLKSSKTIILSLFDEKSIQDALLSHDELNSIISPGSTVIDTTTHNPEFAKLLFKTFKQHEINYLDAPVSGGPLKAATGDLAIMVGGDKTVYLEHKLLLDALGSHVYLLGTSGSGQGTKLVNQLLVGISQLATAEAMFLARQLELDQNNVIKVIRHSAGDSEIFRRSAPQTILGDYSKGFQTNLITKDLREISKIMNNDANLKLVKTALEVLSVHEKGEYKEIDAASVIESYPSKPDERTEN
jgi:3-hydroxyisobutyrate dehydrogenase